MSTQQPWQMTAVQHRVHKRTQLTPQQQQKWMEPEKISWVKGHVIDQWDAEHKAIIEQALAEGQSVPAEVLADYPDLSS